jgi:hypothetical protein
MGDLRHDKVELIAVRISGSQRHGCGSVRDDAGCTSGLRHLVWNTVYRA